MAERGTWDSYFLDLAHTVATRATCSRRQVGAVVVKDRRIVSSGYNGGPSGYPHCLDGACPRAASDAPSGADYERCIAIHAEANALLFASPEQRDGATLYCTFFPCFGCAKLIANAGIAEVVVPPLDAVTSYEGYEDTRTFLHTCDVRVRPYPLGYQASLER